MTETIRIAAQPRSETGKNAARRLRQSGRIPGILYGSGQPTFPVLLNARQLRAVLESETGRNTILTVDVQGGETANAMLVDWQYEPLHSTLLHVDLKRIALDQRLRASVPLVRLGEPPGVKLQGGILEFVMREVEVECLPGDIPEHFQVDVSGLMIGTNLRVRDLKAGEQVRIVSDADLVVVHVVAPKHVEEKPAEAAAPAEAAPAEPEVIRKGKAEKEEEGPGEPTKK